jgi:hypothetical protein
VIQCLGGGCILYAHDDAFFRWWEHQIITIDEYPYEGIIFVHDLDIHVPPNGALEETGKKNFQFSRLFYFLLCFNNFKGKTKIFLDGL